MYLAGVHPFMCDTCGKQYSRKTSMIKHMQSAHPKMWQEKLQESDQLMDNMLASAPTDHSDNDTTVRIIHDCYKNFTEQNN